jgi:hypothetical protein
VTDRDLDAVTTARLLVRPLGFTFWKQARVDGDLRNLYILPATTT